MAASSSSSRRALPPCLALSIVLLFTLCEAREFLVGGRENSWKVPPSSGDLNNWSGRMRFLVGDSIVLKYDAKADAVLEVTKEDYESCNISNPIKKYDDGNTKVVLDRWGPFYFISGAEGHCQGGQKLVVTVLSPKHGSEGQPPAVSLAPAPSPAEFLPPATAPTSDGPSLKGVGVGVGVAVVLGSLVGLAFG